MANLKEVRTRIESVNSTKQITSAMKMVAASKLRKAQNSIMALRPYADKFSEILERIMSSCQQPKAKSQKPMANTQQPTPNSQQPTANSLLIIPLSSNKGLCGTFNANVIRETMNLIKDEYQDLFDKGKIDILCVGSKVEEALRFKKYPVVGNENILLDDITYDNAAAFAERLMKDFDDKKYDKIVFVYNQFKNAATQVLVTEQFLPIISQQPTANGQQPTANGQEPAANSQEPTDYIFMPNKEDIFKEMLPKSLKLQVYKILLDSYASEQGARMISMTQATDNATELLKELNISYNKARQSAITNELVEIISGANALNNS
ncbi:MAG: ATP synthase F1 subunit gamma [Bacteroidales bacterium]|nr:ATP synthase F1 subunit gamma [Bacteroidales bacterium]